MEEVRGPVLLGGYAAWQCPVRVQNDFNALIPKLPWEPSAEDMARQEAGRVFEADVFAALLGLHRDAVLIDPGLRRSDAIAETIAAMEARVPLILGGWLPDDLEGGRKGKPDILIAAASGYLPADVKNHKTLKPAPTKTAVVSGLQRPGDRFALEGWSSAESRKRFRDGVQLAHYTRMLQACGHHAGSLIGAIVGTSVVATSAGESDIVFVWHPLDEPLYDTFSRSQGSKKRSILERYDHEHGFRIKVAQTAQLITGDAGDPDLLVRPIGQDECARCPYGQWCAEEMGPEDASALIVSGRLGIREWRALHRMGIETTADLSAVDVDDPDFFDDYFCEVSNLRRDDARKRLAGAVRRARMICDGTEIVRTAGGASAVPTADIEIDFDIESDIEGRVYMWGVRLRSGTDDSTARYIADFVEWEPLDSPRERDLAIRFVEWLRVQCASAAEAGLRIAVFHWTDYEIARLKSVLGLAEVGDLIDPDTGVFVDLHKLFKADFFSVHGASLKTVAPNFGFSWRVDDPGGAISQLYLTTVQTSSDPHEVAAAKEWLLTYNEDDTAATAAIRDGMRRWPG